MNLHVFLEVLALVLAVLAGVKCPEPPHASYGWIAVAILILVLVLGGVRL